MGDGAVDRQHTELWQTLHAPQDPEPPRASPPRPSGDRDDLRLVPRRFVGFPPAELSVLDATPLTALAIARTKTGNRFGW